MSFCASRYCQFNLPGQVPRNKINFVHCPLCKTTSYCSARCRDYDWQSSHKLVCNTDSPMNTSVCQDQSDVTTLRQMRRTLEEFDIVHQGGVGVHLGKGSYGAVKLVKDKNNAQLFAMKIMVKKEIFEFCNIDNLKREIRIQKKLDHPHVTKLFHYFEDKESVYLILEYAQNGSLYSHLRRCKIFPENEAFVYFFQTCLGIDYLHKNHIIHRDLKPENLLLDEGGNIKICDFGWSAESFGTSQKRTTFCGTIDYMAPEMIENRPHDHTLDLWCLGILLYELVHGRAPFKGRNDIEKCNNIVKRQPIEFEPSISLDLQNLILGLLRYFPNERISMEEIWKHPWMEKISKQYGVDIISFVYVESSWKHSHALSHSSNPILKHQPHRSMTISQMDGGQFSSTSTNTKESTFQKSDQFISFQTKPLYTEKQNTQQPFTESYQDILMKARVSKRSQRNRQEIQPPTFQPKQLGFFDKILIQLGCMKREGQ